MLTPEREKDIRDWYASNHVICGACPNIRDLLAEIDRLRELLRVAKCPNCDGSGATARQVSERRYVTRDMALDAQDPSLEGAQLSDTEWIREQCQWCAERKQLLGKQKGEQR